MQILCLYSPLGRVQEIIYFFRGLAVGTVFWQFPMSDNTSLKFEEIVQLWNLSAVMIKVDNFERFQPSSLQFLTIM